MPSVEPGSTGASMDLASGPLVTVPRKRALAQMVVRVSKSSIFGSTCVNICIIQGTESDLSEVSKPTNNSSSSF